MYLPKAFEETRPEVLHAFMRAHAFATVVLNGTDGPVANHLPLALRPDDGAAGSLVGHVARGNPLWKAAVSGVPCLAIFHGRHHYISPNGYATRGETGRVVPTWNYEVVHAHGTLRAIEDGGWLHALLQESTRIHETGQPAPWTLEEPPADYLDGLMQAIVGLRLEISAVAGKFKLSQNQPATNQQSLIQTLEASADPDSVEMAEAIRGRRQTP
jgi:transcriptional regulator